MKKLIGLFKKLIDSQDSEANSKIILALGGFLLLVALVVAHICGQEVSIEWGWLLSTFCASMLAVDKIPDGVKLTLRKTRGKGATNTSMDMQKPYDDLPEEK